MSHAFRLRPCAFLQATLRTGSGRECARTETNGIFKRTLRAASIAVNVLVYRGRGGEYDSVFTGHRTTSVINPDAVGVKLERVGAQL